MQIHELTQRRHVDEGIMDTAKAAASKVSQGYNTAKQAVNSNPLVQNVKGRIAGAKAGYQGSVAARQDSDVAKQAADLSKRGYDSWSAYARQLTAQYGQDPKFKDIYKQQLLAFVQKNLLGGAYLPNLNNKDQILKSVDDLVAVRFPAGNTPPPPPADGAEPPIMLGGKKLDPKNPNDAKVLAQIKAQGKLKETRLREAVDVNKEKQLFQKLVKDSLLASATVATGQATANNTPGSDTANKQVQDPVSMVPDVQQVEKVKANVDERTLAAVGQVLRQNYQLDPSIRSTGDDAVDALLLAMGFKI